MNKWQSTLVIVLVIVGLITGAKFFLAPKKTQINLQSQVELGCSEQRRD